MASAASRMAGKFTKSLGNRIGSTIRQFGSGIKSAALSSSPGLVGLGGLAQKFGRVSGTELKLGEQKQVQQQMITNKQLDNLVTETKKSYAAQRDAVLAATETLEQIKLLREQGAYQHKELVETVKEDGTGESDGDGKTKGFSKAGAIIEGAKTAGKFIAGAYITYEAFDAIVRAFGRPVKYGRGLKSMGPGEHVPRGTGPGNRTYFAPPPGKGGPGVSNLSMPPDYKKGFASAVMPSSGSQINIKPKAILVEDDKVRKAIEEQSKTLAKTEENTKISAGVNNDIAKREKIRETRVKPTRAEKILGDAQAKFLKGFEETTTKIFREGLEKLLPEPGVSAAEAAGEMYRGQTLRGMTGLDKAANKIFGKEYGPLFAELGTAYLEVGASSLAENLFSSTFGTDEKGTLKSRTVGGQVLGNLAAGKKTRAAESLVYGLTGIPTGVESLANYMGFDSAKQGVGFVADVLGAATTEALRPSSFKGAAATYTDPRTGQTYSYGGGFMDILTGAKQGVLSPESGNIFAQQQRTAALQKRSVTSAQGGGIANVPAIMTDGVATMPVTIVGDETLEKSAGSVLGAIGMPPEYKKGFANAPIYSGGVTPDDVAHSTVDTSETIHQLYENTDEWGSIHEDTMIDTSKADISTQQQVGTGIMGTFQQVGTFLMSGLDNIVSAIAGMGRGGGGTSVNIGGFGGSGDFMSMIGNVVGSTAIAYGVNKLTSKIKDPNLRMIANVAGNFAGQKFLMGNLGGIGGTGASIFSQGQALASVGDYFRGFDIMNPSSYLPGYGGGMIPTGTGMPVGTTGPQVPGGYGNFTAAQAASAGFGSSPVTLFENASTLGKIGQGVGYAYALYQLTQGNVVGAATSAFTTYAFASMNPYAIAAAVVLNVLGIGKKKPKKPVLERSLAIRGNNDPKAIITVQQRHRDMSDIYAGVDSFLMAAFNNLKLVESKTGKTPFTHTSMFIRLGSDTIFCLYRESEASLVYNERGDKWGGIKYHKNFGKPDDAFKKPGTVLKQIIEFINASLRTELGESEEGKIAEAATIINRKSYGELTASTIKELDNLNPEISDAYGAGGYRKSSFDVLEEKRLELQRQGLVGESGFESAETTAVTRTETVSYGDGSDEVITTTKEPVGIVDVGTGQIVPYGTEITYTEADGTQKTIMLNRDAIGANKIVAIQNGIPIFDLGAGSTGRFDYQDYVAHGRRYNIVDLTQPNTFLEEVARLDPLEQYQMETYGEGLRKPNAENTITPAIVAPTTNNNDNSQTITITPGSFNSDGILHLTVVPGG